jgi:hypothetical protein
MIVADALFALFLSLVLILVLGVGLRMRGPWSTPWALFLVLFLFTWAAGAWASPVGPTVYDVYWLPFALFGLFLLLFVAATAKPLAEPEPAERPEEESEVAAEARAAEHAAAGITVFFWLMLGLLVVAIVARYV